MSGTSIVSKWHLVSFRVLIVTLFHHILHISSAVIVLNAGLGALEALGSDVLGVQDSTGYFQGSLGFGLWLQLMCCTYLLTLSEYFE